MEGQKHIKLKAIMFILCSTKPLDNNCSLEKLEDHVGQTVYLVWSEGSQGTVSGFPIASLSKIPICPEQAFRLTVGKVWPPTGLLNL